jgi:hypothetical protein
MNIISKSVKKKNLLHSFNVLLGNILNLYWHKWSIVKAIIFDVYSCFKLYFSLFFFNISEMLTYYKKYVNRKSASIFSYCYLFVVLVIFIGLSLSQSYKYSCYSIYTISYFKLFPKVYSTFTKWKISKIEQQNIISRILV